MLHNQCLIIIRMWNFTTSLLEKFAGLSPLKSFLKFIFQRFSKDYLDKQPNIDFRNGILDLEDLPLSATKINKSLLLSSPYCMHSGSIKQLRIVIPNLTELSTKSIEVYITGVHISLRPNKQFEKNFQEKLAELKEDQKFFTEEAQQKPLQADSDNSIDFFKQLLKQILTNIKVRIANVCVQLFMGSPSEGSVAKPQYYSMLRVPSLLFERFTDREIGKEGEEFQKYRLEVPQITTHLLRQDMKIPEYGNLTYSERDFPWQYPTANHPSTIMLVGSDDIKNHVNCISLVLRISTDAKRKSKDILVRLDVPNIEVMMEGYQLQILLKYLDQLKEFKQAWKSVMDKQKLHERLQQQQIGIEQSKDFEVPNMTHGKKNSRNSTGGIDIFASVVIAFEDDGTEKRQSQKRKTDFIDSIFLENDSEAQRLKKQMLTFNREVSAEFKGNMVQDKTDYKRTFTVDVGVQLIRLYLLKYNTFTATEYERCWAKLVNKKFLWLNENIPCSYFQFSLKSLALQLKDSEHITLSVRKADLKNIKLFTQEDEAIFHDPINQSTASFDARGLADSPKQKQGRLGRQLIKFVIKQGDHYCSSTLLSVSPRGSAKVYKDGRNKRYNLLADATLGEKLPSCLTVKLQKNKKQLNVQVEVGRVGLLVDLEAGRDLINIVYPMFMYRHLVESINLKWQEPSQNSKKNNPMSIYYSNYGTASIGRDAEHNGGGDKSSSHQKKSLSLEVKSIRLAMLDNNPRLFENLAERERRKTEDWQSFERDCFCECSGTTVGLEIREITCNIQKKSVVARVGELELGSFELTTTKPALFTPFVVLADPNRPVELFHEKIQDGGIKTKRFVGLYIPKCELSVPGRDHPTRLADMVHQHAKACLLLKNYFRDLRQQMSLLQTGKPPQPKQKGLNAIPVFFMLDIENINIYYASFGILVKHVIVEFETTKLITVKINDALIIELENRRVVLKSSDPAKLTQQSYDPQGYSIERFSSTTTKISSDRIIVWLDGCTAFNSPNFQARDRSYYAWLQKQYYCIEITVKKSIAERPQLTKACQIKQTQTFSFAKPKKQEKPKEQQQNLCTEIKIKTPLCVRSCELKELPKLLDDILFLKTHTDRIQKDLKSLSPKQAKLRNKEMKVTFRADRLLVDSFPYYEKQVNCSILSNSRSALNIQQFYFEMVKIEKLPQINQSKQKMSFHCQMKEINGGFLVFKDSYPESNPITMPVDHFKDYGFRDIAVLKCVVFDMCIEEFQAKRKEIDLSISIDHVEYSSSASTTLHLQNHIADVLKCIPKPPPKRQANPPRPVIEIDSDCQNDSQQEAVDLNEVDLKHERQKQQRAQEQKQLRQRNIEIVVRPNYFTHINVRQVAIKSLIVTIFSGDDFSFLPTNPTEIKYREKDVAIHLNQDNSVMTVMQLESQKQFVETRVRFRGGEVNWHKFIKAELVGLDFRMLKQNQKTGQQPFSHLQCKMRIGSAFCYLSQMQADRFVILKLSEELLIGVEKQYSKIKVKTSVLPKIQMGFNSTLNFISKERKQAKQLISQSSFARKQVNKEALPRPAEVVNDLLLFIPEFAMVLDVKLVGISVFKQLEVKVGELLFHNQLSQYLEEDNKAFIKSWVRQILKGNIGSLLGNSFIHILQQGMWLLLAAIKQLFGLPGELFRALTR